MLSPEGITAIKAAWHNRMQRSVNLMLGSALSTMGLTAPTVLLISVLTGEQLVFGLDQKDMVLLATTLLLCSVTFWRLDDGYVEGLRSSCAVCDVFPVHAYRLGSCTARKLEDESVPKPSPYNAFDG